MSYDKTVRQLHVPDFKEVAGVLKNGLGKNFKNVQVDVVKCPDLSKPPYSLASPSLSVGSVINIGGVINMEFLQNNNKYHYDLKQIVKDVNLPFFIGAAASKPAVSKVKDNSELMPNANVKTGVNNTKEAYVDHKTGNCCLVDYKSTELSSLGNLFACEGNVTQDVFKVKVSVRTGELNFITCMRKAIDEYYKDKQIGFGGVFTINKGKFKSHVMPGFPPCDVFGKDIAWLTFYTVDAPVTCLSVVLSNDKHGDGARLEHTHFVSTRNDGGHYHYDVTPETIEYEGYFTLANKFYRIAKAIKPTANL